MVAGHLQEKNGFFYIVLNYKDSNGKRKTKWEATGLPVKKTRRRRTPFCRNGEGLLPLQHLRLRFDWTTTFFLLILC